MRRIARSTSRVVGALNGLLNGCGLAAIAIAASAATLPPAVTSLAMSPDAGSLAAASAPGLRAPRSDAYSKADFFGFVQRPEPTAALRKSDARVSMRPKRGLMRSMELRTNVAVDAGKWRDYMRRAARDVRCGQGASGCDPAYRAWRAMLNELRNEDPWVQLIELNRRINRLVRYRNDRRRYGKPDHWASPREFLTAKGGDCEDFALLKYLSLRELGIADRRMRLVVVHDTRRKQEHAVLSVAMPEGRQILDSLDPMPRPHGVLAHYVPRYSVNGAGVWIHVRPRSVSDSARQARSSAG